MTAAALKSRTRAAYKHFSSYQTRWADNDMYGHLNNSVYNFLTDSAVNAYLIAACGLRPADAAAPQIGLVVASQCAYFAPLAFPEHVDVGLRVNRVGRSSVEYEVGFFRAGEDRAAAVGGFTHVFVDRAGRRPVRALAPEMRAGLERICVDGARL